MTRLFFKIRRWIRRVSHCSIFSCLICGTKSEKNNELEEDNKMTISKVISEGLQLALIEEQEYNDQFWNALLCFMDILEQLSTCHLSNNSLITCHADSSNQSLRVINECDSNLLQQHRILSCPEWSSDKATQSNSNLSSNRFVQTKIYTDVGGFKLQLLRQLRNLKQDVITLKELVFHFDSYHYPLGDLGICNRREIGYKVIEANRTRATNFVRFYKLRKSKRKKKSSISGAGSCSGRSISIDAI